MNRLSRLAPGNGWCSNWMPRYRYFASRRRDRELAGCIAALKQKSQTVEREMPTSHGGIEVQSNLTSKKNLAETHPSRNNVSSRPHRNLVARIWRLDMALWAKPALSASQKHAIRRRQNKARTVENVRARDESGYAIGLEFG